MAMANMVANGRKFAVVQKPDWCGGHFVTPANINDYCLQDFEYILWEGTPSEFAEQMPTFSEHYEPLHGKPEDTEVGAKELLKWYLNF